MTQSNSEITVINQQLAQLYDSHFAGCLVLTHNGRLLLQKRGEHWDRYPGMLATFGGQLELGETEEQGLVRELKEGVGV